MFGYFLICVIITLIVVGPNEGWFDNIVFLCMSLAFTPVVSIFIYKCLMGK